MTGAPHTQDSGVGSQNSSAAQSVMSGPTMSGYSGISGNFSNYSGDVDWNSFQNNARSEEEIKKIKLVNIHFAVASNSNTVVYLY